MRNRGKLGLCPKPTEKKKKKLGRCPKPRSGTFLERKVPENLQRT
jgi:hypothetical protein